MMKDSKFKPVYIKLSALIVGEQFIIHKIDWDSLYSPATVLNRLGNKEGKKFSYKRLEDETAWCVTRVV